MKHGSYDKLDESGNIPEEHSVEYGDIIIGKVTPIQAVGNSNKVFRDSSTIYKDTDSGIVDRIWQDIYTTEGYEMRKMRVRSERIPNIGDKLCCFEQGHDILTTDGWIDISQVTKDHKVACLINDELKYIHPLAIQEYDYRGKMYNVETSQLSLNVTPNHRMYVRKPSNPKYDIVEAKDLVGKIRKYKKTVDGGIRQKGLKYFVLPKTELYSKRKFDIDSWLIFFGIWIAEGWLERNVVIIAAHKQRVKDAFTICCEKLNFDIKKRKTDDGQTNKWFIRDKQLTDYMSEFNVGAVNKFLPEWVWQLNTSQAKILIEGMMLGDGYSYKNGTTRRYDTSSKKLADDFQKLCFHAGYATNMLSKTKAGYTAIIKSGYNKGRSITSTVDSYRITILRKNREHIVNKNVKQDRYVDFDGKVYCCTVPGEGIMYVRRNGKPVWCGNSRHGQKGRYCPKAFKYCSP